MNIDLIPTEKTPLKQDNILMKMVVKLNTTNHTNNVSTTDIFPDAVAIPDMLD